MSSVNHQHDFLEPPEPSNGAPADYLGSLSHYRVLRELGKGGMGYVFLAQDNRLKREVALKVMNQKIAATPGSRKRFISEARAMAAVHHDNVATIFEVGEFKGTPFMAMELLEGSTLEKFKDEDLPDYHQVIAYAKDIARGLAAAHAQGIVHRDIKPANIWLDTKSNRIKILDFGLALAQTPVDGLSGRGAVVGTPGYLSPEQARSEPLDDRSDLYSAGVVLYELATGKLPLKTKSVAEQLIAILVVEPKPLRELNEKIPQPLADLIHQLMAKEPRDRISSAAKLAERLEEAEVECESKSEVAQAINQLQMGLDQVVKKQSTDVDVPTVAPIPNPFESLPDATAGIDPLAIPAAGAASLGSGVSAPAALPAGGSGMYPAAGPAPKKKPDNPLAGKLGIWLAIGGIAVGLLIVLPLAVFFGTSNSGNPHERQARVIAAPENLNNQNNNANRSGNNNANASGNNRQQGNGANRNNGGNNQRNAGGNRNSTKPLADATPVSVAKSPTFTGFQVQGSKWLINPKQGNGSFEAKAPANNKQKIPGWTLEVNGPDGGWAVSQNDVADTGKVHAYAGAKSELRITSDALKYTTKANDVFRISLSVGGEGKGATEYRVVLGLKGASGPPSLYELAKIQDRAKWPGTRPKRLRYQFDVPASDVGKTPFLQLTASNLNGPRTRAYMDRATLIVFPKSKLAQSPNNAQVARGNAPASRNNPSVSSPQPKAQAPRGNTAPRGNAAPNRSATNNSTTNNASPGANNARNNNNRNPANSGSGAPKTQRRVTLKTDDPVGADTTVKRGSSATDALGLDHRLAVQSRNGVEIQHVYLRFNHTLIVSPTSSGGSSGGPSTNRQNQYYNRANNQGFASNGRKKSADIEIKQVTLRLNLAGSQRPKAAKLRVYGLDDPVSNIWPENRMVWNNSLSNTGLGALPLLADLEIGAGKANAPMQVEISSPELTKFLSNVTQPTFTLILTGENGNQPILFAAKEDPQAAPPQVDISILE